VAKILVTNFRYQFRY